MDLIQGGELRELLEIHKNLPERTVKFLAVQIIDAVNFLHQKNIAHRDLKLENVLIDQEGYIHIIDFGISKKIEPNLETGTFCGTKEYMAPEILEGQHYNKSVDWWAIGIMLYELIFGCNPFNLLD